MKIIFISTIEGGNWGGSEALWYKASQHALTKGFDVIISVAEDQMLNKDILNKLSQFPIVHKWAPNIKQSNDRNKIVTRIIIKTGLGDYRNSFDVLEEFKPDIICISQGGFTDIIHNYDLYNFLVKTNLNFSVINHSYNFSDLQKSVEKEMIKLIYSKAKKVFFVAETQKSDIERSIGENIKNSQVILNPLKLDINNSLPFPSAEKIRFCMLSSLETKWKGQDLIIETLSSPKWKVREWDLEIYGSGTDEAYIKQLIVFYGLEDRVSLPGNASDVTKAFKNSHLVLFPSRQDVVPLSMIEALVCARPVLVTRIGGMAEWVKHEINGFIAEGTNSYALDLALENAWQRRSNWNKMGLEANSIVKSRYLLDPVDSFLKHLVK